MNGTEQRTLVRNIGANSMQRFTYTDQKGKIKATFSSLGMVTSIEVNNKEMYKRVNGLGTIQLGVDGGKLVDQIYRDIESERFDETKHNDFRWHTTILDQRFDKWNGLVEEGDIVPRCSDDTVILTASKGCPKSCSFCPMSSSYTVLNKAEVEARIRNLKNLVSVYHPDSSTLMDRGFMGGAGLAFLPRNAGEKAYTGVETAALFRERLGLKRVAGFMDTDMSVRAPLEYHRRLREQVDHVYWGLESGSQVFGGIVDKHFTTEERRRALDHLLEAGYEVTPILMTGLGSAAWYTDSSEVTTWRDALAITKNIILYDGKGNARPDEHIGRMNLEVSQLVASEDSELGRTIMEGAPYIVKHIPTRGKSISVRGYHDYPAQVTEEREDIRVAFGEHMTINFDYGLSALPFFRGKKEPTRYSMRYEMFSFPY